MIHDVSTYLATFHFMTFIVNGLPGEKLNRPRRFLSDLVDFLPSS